MERDEFSTLDIVKALGDLGRERLRDWMDQGFVRPGVPASGRGTKAVFTRAEVYGVALFKLLVERGINRKIAKEGAKIFVEHGLATSITHLCYTSNMEGTERKIYSHYFVGRSALYIEIGVGNGPSDQACKLTHGLSEPLIIDDWDDVHIVNIQKLQDKVDAALSALR
jgi:hypothetical protein